MMGMNMWGSIYMSLFMFGWPSGGGWEAVKFLQEHPMAAWDILLFCLCGAVGQNFIFLTISRFGALTNTTITTTRKFVSILVSSVWNGNHLSLQQWAGVAMVFSGLSYQIYLKWTRKNSHTKSRSATSAVDHTDLKKSKWPCKLESEDFLLKNITHCYILSLLLSFGLGDTLYCLPGILLWSIGGSALCKVKGERFSLCIRLPAESSWNRKCEMRIQRIARCVINYCHL